MNKNKLDKLFYHKLSGKETIPPPQAWMKLNEKVKQKRNKVILYRYAASVIFLLSFSAVIIILKLNDPISGNLIVNNNERQTNKVIKEFPLSEPNNILEENNSGTLIIESKDQLSAKELENHNKNIKATILSPSINNSTDSKKIHKDQVIFFSESDNIKLKEITLEDEELHKVMIEKVAEDQENLSSYPKVTITFKRGTYSEATDNALASIKKEPADQESRLKKFIQTAKELKLSEVNLAEIRETKDELFNLKPKL
jgi:hypothetical protein